MAVQPGTTPKTGFLTTRLKYHQIHTLIVHLFLDAVSVLLDHDSSLKENKVAIVEAAIRGYNGIVELLLDYGIDPNGLDDIREMDTAPLIEAVRFHR